MRRPATGNPKPSLPRPERRAETAPDTASQLLGRVRQGDARAFEALVTEHYPFIYRTALRRLAQASDAEDVAQTVCLRLPDAIRRFDGRSKFTSWLYAITLNAVRDLQRSRRRQDRNAAAVTAAAQTAWRPDQEDHLRVDDIWRVVHTLPARQREAVLLVYERQLSQAEAAAIMGCRDVTVSWHIHNARKALRGRL